MSKETEVQEPTATYTCGVCGVPMQMEQPTQRQWVGLTEAERESVLDSVPPDNMGGEYYDKEITAIAVAIEAKLKEKNERQ